MVSLCILLTGCMDGGDPFPGRHCLMGSLYSGWNRLPLRNPLKSLCRRREGLLMGKPVSENMEESSSEASSEGILGLQEIQDVFAGLDA